MRTRTGGFLLVAFALPLALACAGRGIVPREYVLVPVPRTQTAGDAPGPRVSVGPVELPDYLRRRQVVRRARPNELRASDAEIWGEDLAAAFARVLAEDLSALIPTERVEVFPGQAGQEPLRADFRVILAVERFEADADGAVRLDVRWRLARGGGDPIVVRRSSFAEPAAADTPSTVDAMSRALGALAREISDAIRSSAAAPR